MNQNAGIERLRRAIFPLEKVQVLVQAFYDKEGPFAGNTFLDLIPNEPNVIGPSDLLSVTLMGEMYRPDAVRQLLQGEVGRKASESLARIPSAVPMWDLTVEELAGPSTDLWWLLYGLREVRATRVSKLMARKRPMLIPIFDSVIENNVANSDEYWGVFHAFLSDPTNRRDVDSLRPSGYSYEQLPTLRLLDTAVWMRHSRGINARRAREAISL